jgi:hypothetical protein
MKRLLRQRLSPATVIACLALLIALSGTSYAAIRLPVNSVGSKQIKNSSIQRVDLGRKTIASLRGQRGPQGAQGIQGAQGSQGATGAAGATNVVVRVGSATNLPPNSLVNVLVSCQAGERATGGGAANQGTAGVHMEQSLPTGAPPTGWEVTYFNTTGSTATGFAFVVCASP